MKSTARKKNTFMGSCIWISLRPFWDLNVQKQNTLAYLHIQRLKSDQVCQLFSKEKPWTTTRWAERQRQGRGQRTGILKPPNYLSTTIFESPILLTLLEKNELLQKLYILNVHLSLILYNYITNIYAGANSKWIIIFTLKEVRIREDSRYAKERKCDLTLIL